MLSFLYGLEGVPGLPGTPQDEAGLPRKFETSPVARSGGEKGLRGSGAGTLGVPLEGTRRVGGLLVVAGRPLEVCGKVAAQEGSGGDQVRETVLSRGTWQWPILPPGPSDWKRGPGREDMTGGGLAGKACGLRAWEGGDEAALGHPLSSPLPTPCPALKPVHFTTCSRTEAFARLP